MPGPRPWSDGRARSSARRSPPADGSTPGSARPAHLHVGCLDTGSEEWPLGDSSKPIEALDAGTGTVLPLTFIVTELFPRVSSSLAAVSVGIAFPTFSISPGISFLPVPSTTQTYTWPVGVSCSFTVLGLATGIVIRRGPRCLGAWWLGGRALVVGVELLFLLALLPTIPSTTTTSTSTSTINAHGGTRGPLGRRSRSRLRGVIGRSSWSLGRS